MRSVNFPLRKKYYSLLTGITYNDVLVPSFYQKAPNDLVTENYIVFGEISSNDTSSKYKAETETSIRLTIHTYKSIYNSGESADSIANEIFARVYPNGQVNHDLSEDSLQVVNTRLSSDYTQNYNINNEREYIDRHLTFTHIIFHQ